MTKEKPQKQKILIVDDVKENVDILDQYFTSKGFETITSFSAKEAIEKAQKYYPDIILSDVMMPEMDGFQLCEALKKEMTRFRNIPFILITVKDDIQSKIKGLSLGADDYVTKPFIPDELIARIKTRLRDVIGEKTLRVLDLVLDKNTVEVKRAGKPIKLTKTEFKLLEFLMRNQGKVLKRELILNHVWGYTPDIDSRAVDVYIGYLRRKA